MMEPGCTSRATTPASSITHGLSVYARKIVSGVGGNRTSMYQPAFLSLTLCSKAHHPCSPAPRTPGLDSPEHATAGEFPGCKNVVICNPQTQVASAAATGAVMSGGRMMGSHTRYCLAPSLISDFSSRPSLLAEASPSTVGRSVLLLLTRMLHQSVEHVSRTQRRNPAMQFQPPQKPLVDCTNAIPRSFTVPWSACLPHHLGSTGVFFQVERVEKSGPVLDVRRCTICVDVPEVEHQSTGPEMACQMGHTK